MPDLIKLQFNSEFKGVMTSPTGTVLLGDQDGGQQPYHLLFGALGSCFYATFLSIAIKKRLQFSQVEIEVSGNKRESIPSTLENVTLLLRVYNPSNETGLIKSAELGAKYCSIHETISQVAKIELVVEFVNE
jgi:putative redox protein